jgi:hypothetical protein
MKLELSLEIFEQSSNSKFYENPSSGKRVVLCGRRDGHDEAIVAFRNFSSAPKNGAGSVYDVDVSCLYDYGFRSKYTKILWIELMY